MKHCSSEQKCRRRGHRRPSPASGPTSRGRWRKWEVRSRRFGERSPRVDPISWLGPERLALLGLPVHNLIAHDPKHRSSVTARRRAGIVKGNSHRLHRSLFPLGKMLLNRVKHFDHLRLTHEPNRHKAPPLVIHVPLREERRQGPEQGTSRFRRYRLERNRLHAGTSFLAPSIEGRLGEAERAARCRTTVAENGNRLSPGGAMTDHPRRSSHAALPHTRLQAPATASLTIAGLGRCSLAHAR